MVRSLAKRDSMEPARFSVFEGKVHKVSVGRNSAGDFVASASPLGGSVRAALSASAAPWPPA